MNSDEVQYLAALLDQAVSNCLGTHDRWYRSIDVGTYGRLLRTHWTRQWSDLDSNHPNHYKPRIVDEAIRNQLTEFLKQALGPHIIDGRVQTAAIEMVGGNFQGISLDDLSQRVLEVAIGRGSQHAARAFYQCLLGHAAVFRRVGYLLGVRVEEEIEVRPGIHIVTLPNSTADLPAYFPLTMHMDPIDLLGQTIILVDHKVSPIFAAPDGLKLPEDIFAGHQICTDLPDFDIVEFCEALSIASDRAIVCDSQWTHIDPDSIFLCRWQHTGSHIIWRHGLRSRGSAAVTEETVREAVQIYEARRSLDRENADKLAVPIKRWIKSKSDQSLVDTFIDSGIALESLYFEDMGDRSELTYRLRLRAAWFIGNGVEDRKSLMDHINAIYRLRSRAVHDGSVGDDARTKDLTEKAQHIARLSIIKTVEHIVEQGKFPDWERLVLGDTDERKFAGILSVGIGE